MEVAATAIVGLELAGIVERQPRLRGGCEVSGAAHQPRDVLGDRVQHLSRRVPAGDALRVGWERGNVGVPSVRELAALDPPDLVGEVGMLGLILG
jgi:hypothetical protein